MEKHQRSRLLLNEALRSYPELMSEDIRVEVTNPDDALMTVCELTGGGYCIEVDTTPHESSGQCDPRRFSP